MEPDSYGYVDFYSTRTAIYPIFMRALMWLGLSLQAITYVQVAVFCVSLMILIAAMQRASIKRCWIVLFVVLLGSNSYFSSFQRTILTESIGFSVVVVATAFLLEYLRTGQVLWLALAGLFIGLEIGIRSAGIFLLPMLALAVWLKLHHRNVTIVTLVAALIVPPAIAPGFERLIHRVEHGDRADSILPYVLVGKAAMLINDNTVFTGPASVSLNQLGRKLNASYKPAHEYLHSVPSWVAAPTLTAFFEAAAQFQVINKDIAAISDQAGFSPDYLREELGKQAIRANVSGFALLTMTHYCGQWSITALTFPPSAHAVRAYSSSLVKVPLIAEIRPTHFFRRQA